MRILHCIPNMFTGGAQRQLTYLAEEQIRRGCEVHVAYLHGGPNAARLEQSPATRHILVNCGNHNPGLIWQLVQLIRRIRPDIVQTWLTQMDVLGGSVARMMRVPWVLSERSCSAAYPPTIKNRMRSWIGATASAVVSNSPAGDAYWQGRVEDMKRSVIQNGFPLEEMNSTPAAKPLDVGLPPGRKMLLYAGRLSPEKNLENLFAAIRLANAEVSLASYICGDGIRRSWTEHLLDAGTISNTFLMGYVPAIWAWMKLADIFVSVSTFEGDPNGVLEAVACGCPVVLSDIPSHRRIVGAGHALFVNPNSPPDIAKAIIASLDNPSEAKRRAQLARCSLVHRSVPEIAAQYDGVYRKLTAQRQTRMSAPSVSR